MSFLSSMFCGCFNRGPEDAPPSSSQREMQASTHTWSQARNSVQTGRFTLTDDGEFIRVVDAYGQDGHGPPSQSDDGGYASVVPLPQYTPRPMSIHEKTLESHMRDPSVSSDSNGYLHDEKSPNLYEEEVASDTASTFSYPSSYGNTSTATRETPPPPYSPRMSAVIARSRSISISSARAVTINPPPMARLSGGRTTAPPSDADDQSIRRHRRVSWESR